MTQQGPSLWSPRTGMRLRRLVREAVRISLLPALALLCSGCEDAFRSETVIGPDGEVIRAIYQPEEKTPADARVPNLWERVTHAPPHNELEPRGWPASLTRFPAHAKDDAHPYFVAWGKFRSAAAIPDHLVMSPPEGVNVPAGRLVRDYARRDYGFLVEHRWKETLTDCVSLDDMRQARRELVELLAGLAGALFDDALGQDYDGSGLVTWLRTEGSSWLAEVTDTLFVYGASRSRHAKEKAWDDLAAICARHGLMLKQEGKFLEEAAARQRIEQFLTTLVVTHVRRRGGQPLAPEEAARLRDRLLSGDQPGEGRGTFEASFRKVVARDHGGEGAFARRAGTLVVRIVGLYHLKLFGPGRFHYDLTVPGEIVETNGQLLAPNRVLWQFGAADAYPFGFTMECRSLAVVPEALKLLPGKPLADREAMLRLTEVLEGQEALIKALHECRRQGSLRPLAEYRAALAAGARPVGEVQPLYDLFKLLSIDPE